MSLDFQELEALKEQIEKPTNNQNNDFLKNFVKLPAGNGHLLVRLLPPAPPGMFGRQQNPFKMSTRIHRINERNIHCPREKVGKRWIGPCPVCEYYSEYWKTRIEPCKNELLAKEMKDFARTLKATDRFYFNVIVRQQVNEETKQLEKDVGPLIFPAGIQILNIILLGIMGNEAIDEKPLGDVTDPVTGRDFKLIKAISAGDGYPSYTQSKFQDVSPLGTPEQIARWTEGLHDLTTLRKVLPYEEIKVHLKKHLGVIPRNDSPSGFDMSEYEPQKTSATVTADMPETVAVTTAPAAATSAVSKQVLEDITASFDDELVDVDFIDDIKNMPS